MTHKPIVFYLNLDEHRDKPPTRQDSQSTTQSSDLLTSSSSPTSPSTSSPSPSSLLSKSSSPPTASTASTGDGQPKQPQSQQRQNPTSDSIAGRGGNMKSRDNEENTDASPKKSSTKKPDIQTLSDSAPLLREIEELKRAKTKVERGSPTLRQPAQGNSGTSPPLPSHGGRDPRQGSTIGTPYPTIPKQSTLDTKPRLTRAAPIEEDYSPAESVMTSAQNVVTCTQPPVTCAQQPVTCTQNALTCTESKSSSTQSNQPIRDQHPTGTPAGGDILPSHQLPPIADTTRRDHAVGSRSPRSPMTKQKRLIRQREERDIKLKDYRAISPKGSPVISRGKPPLPRSPTPVRRSPSASPAPQHSDKSSVRSKSVGDMEPAATPGHSPQIVHRQVQEAINKFDKRRTVCDADERPVLRKTPSPTLHLPHVGLVTRYRRLKPAVELLEESHRYRNNQPVYNTRLQRYLAKEDRSRLACQTVVTSHNKENVSSVSYVNTMVQRLSRETTPVRSGVSSRTNSNLSLHGTTPGTQPELGSRVARTLSNGSNSETNKNASPLKDVTNGGHVKKLSPTFDDHLTKISPERTLSDSDIDKRPRLRFAPSDAKPQYRKSIEVAMVTTSGQSSTTYTIVSSPSSTGSRDMSYDNSDLESSSAAYQSLPALESHDSPDLNTASSIGRGRAYTYSVTEPVTGRRPPRSSEVAEQVVTGKSNRKDSKPGRSRKKESGDRSRFCPSTSLSPERRGKGRGKMGTIGVLCKQSMSFDLGVSSQYGNSSKEDLSAATKSPKSGRKPRSWDPTDTTSAMSDIEVTSVDDTSVFLPASGGGSDMEDERSRDAERAASSSSEPTGRRSRPGSDGSEGEIAPEVRRGAGRAMRERGEEEEEGDDKKRSKKFLDSSWLQKSKKFFKVSK